MGKKIILDFENGGEEIEWKEGEDLIVGDQEVDQVEEEKITEEDIEEVVEDLADEIEEMEDEEEEVEPVDGEDDSEESELEVDDSPYKKFGDTIKGIGLLPDDYEVPDDIDGEGLINEVGNYLIPKYREQAKNEALQELQKELINQGITQEDLFFAKARRTGANSQILDNLARYESIKDVDLDNLDDDKKIELVHFMYTDKGLSSFESSAVIKQHEDDLDPLVKKVVEYADAKYKGIKREEVTRQQEFDKATAQREQYNKQYIENIFTNSKLGDYDLDQEDLNLIRNSIYRADTPLEVNGQTHMVSAYDRFLYYMNNSLDFQMKVFYQVANQEKLLNRVREVAEDKIEKNFLDKHPTRQVPLKKKKIAKKTKKVVHIPKSQEVSTRY